MKSRIVLLTAMMMTAAISLAACGGTPAQKTTPEATKPAAVSAPKADAQPVKDGATKMRQTLAELKGLVSAGDAAKAQAAAKETDETWEKFEDQVKEQDKALYEKIEDPLHAILAGVKVTPLDKAVLTGQIDQLDGLLAGLAK